VALKAAERAPHIGGAHTLPVHLRREKDPRGCLFAYYADMSMNPENTNETPKRQTPRGS